MLTLFFPALAQKTVVSGKVTEAATGTPIPFANVIFTGTQEGAITDFEGNFVATIYQQVDSIEVRYIGFVKRVKPLVAGTAQVINFQLEEDMVTLGEVVVYSGENPAFRVLRNVVKNKKNNDKRSLEAYEYESYTKIEFDVDNISDKLRQRKIMQKITRVLDSIEQVAGEDGQPVLPVFISEAVSRFYYRNNPTNRHENIIKTKVSAVGITDGTLTSQVIGSTFQEYNFYQNWLNIINKDFVSPIADGWKIYYEYDLVDSLYVGDKFCYRLDFFPRSEQDLAFTGTMWITKEEYALRRIDAYVPKTANLNFIEKIKIQQDLIKTEAGPWLPEKTRVVVDVAQLTDQTAGLLGKFYVSTRDHVINKPMPDRFYLNPVSMEEDVREYTEDYWEEHRHDSLTATEEHLFQMIDTLKKIPVVKTYTDIAKFAINGYHKIGLFDIGPYTTFVGNNDVEGLRLGFGARTTIDFSRKWVLGGYFGYGFDDDRWKYRVFAERIFDRDSWTTLRYEQQKEIEQVWLLNEDFEPNSLFYSLSRFGTLTQPYMIDKYRLTFFRQVLTGLSQKVAFKHVRFDPQYDFQFYESPESPVSSTSSDFNISEINLTTRYARDEIFLLNDNERLSLGTVRWPALTFSYTYGFKGILASDFEYHKLKFSLEKRQKMGLLGVSNIRLASGYVIGDLPYPLLYNAIGNETPVYVGFAYNLMDFFEFSTDKYAELRYRHSFEGFFLNRIPLMKKLKWRLIGSANILVGGLRDENIALVKYPVNAAGEEERPFYQLDHRPYVELGYGIENILKFFSVEAFHRLTYLDRPNVNNFALKFNVQIIL